jgi:hypothetical protein
VVQAPLDVFPTCWHDDYSTFSKDSAAGCGCIGQRIGDGVSDVPLGIEHTHSEQFLTIALL